MVDLRGFIGAQTQDNAPSNAPNGKLLPDVPINLIRLRSSDLDIEFKAMKIDQPGWPIDNMQAHFLLQNGILRIDPLSFGVAEGTIKGLLVLDGQKDVPNVHADLTLKCLSLKPFFQNPTFESLSEGHFGGRFDVTGDGKSLADVLADGNGRITMMMACGTLRKLIVDAAGLDAKVIPALLCRDEKTGLRCAITDFGMKDGMLRSRIFVIDTKASNIQGSANINLKNETIDAKIEGNLKDVTVAGQIPITISGPMKSPSIGLETKSLAARGGIAGALGAVLTPIAAIIPFIDIDTAGDSDCGALLNAAKNHSGVNPATVAPAQ